MAVQILSQSYGPRKPLIECTADSLTELAGLVCAEGSTATVGDTEYVLDRVNGWVEPGSSGGGSGVLVVNKDKTPPFALDKTWQEIFDAASTGVVFLVSVEDEQVSTDLVRTVYLDDGTYSLEDSATIYSTNSASGYPSMTGPIEP